MLYQPTNITPSSFAGVGGDLIDAAGGMTITWQVNGTSAMTGYEIVIYRNDTASTQLYTTGVVTISPFYGIDGMGNVQLYSVTITAADLSTAGIVNGDEDGYKYKITQYWSVSDYVEQSAENFFIAQAAPTCSINTMYLYSPSDPVTASWSQSDGVGMDWVRWVVTELNDDTVLIDTGNIHTQVMQLDYDGWVNGTRYSVTLTYQLQNGYSASTNAIVTAEWTNITQRGSASASLGANCSEAIVSYPIPTYGEIQNAGAVTATVVDGKLVNPSGSTLTWNIETLVTNRVGMGGLAWSGTPEEAVTLAIHAAVTNPVLEETLTLTIDPAGTVSWSVGVATGSYAAGESFTGKTVTFLAGENTWYLAVYDGSARNIYSFDAPITLMILSELVSSTISLAGRQTCNWLGLTNGAASQTLINTALAADGAQPDFGNEWLFLSGFAAIGLQYIGSLDDVSWAGVTPYVSSIVIYRRESGASVMKKLAVITNARDVGKFADYGIVSGKSYTYSVQYLFDDSSSLSANTVMLTTNAVTPCYWDWLLTEAEEADDGTYHVVAEYRFGLNVATEAMSNNNVPALMQNFTRYPTRQGTSANYRSGTLSAYIGRVDQERNIYIDTAAQADAIMAIGASENTKFLRSRKGELWMVDTAGATTLMLEDNYKEQPYTAVLTWAEIGDASDVSIIALPSDAIWTDSDTTAAPTTGGTVLRINGLAVDAGATIVIGR